MDTVSGSNSYFRVQTGPKAENGLSVSNPILLLTPASRLTERVIIRKNRVS
jgi:hypothetical protein